MPCGGRLWVGRQRFCDLGIEQRLQRDRRGHRDGVQLDSEHHIQELDGRYDPEQFRSHVHGVQLERGDERCVVLDGHVSNEPQQWIHQQHELDSLQPEQHE